MKLKSLLFGSAAAVVAVTGAQAADLPIAEPVEYVAICDAYGAGYFFIPGGDTCLKIGGTVLADAVYVNEDGIYEAEALVAGDNFNEFGTRVRGQVDFDARTSTEWGVLRSYINLRGEVDTRPERGTNPGGGTGVFNAADAFEINEAFLQLQMDAGIVTAGHTSSAFDFIGSEVFNILSYIDDTSGENNNLSYQAVFGSFTAVVSVEDTFAGAHGRMDTFAVAGSDEGFDVGGTEFPDLVGALQFEQAWGGAQLSGAVGQVSDITEGEELGWAVAFGARVGFGMFSAAGQATYTDGLIGYATNGRAEGLFEADDADSDGPGDLDTNTAWNLKGNVRAGITDAFYAEVSASYTEYNDEDGPDDGEVWGVVGNVGYTLVPGLLLGAEVGYQDVNNHGGNPDGDRWGVAGRVQRSF